ncbi:hypothetical protein Cycma_4992 [Cyclobacterium marinum DSM 745]|uniref:Uncharacterized protein n=1 Tax=Cyclobacterium marinum (strain ATCC 25205 / DSM 745 / LMG 13164 / NCIMB 1802) TaxID=880070 RepID=G0J807_CYCMS|nr:hypothetical protein Cycma_4992 [Cyclobacterium marinum DSM 745]
MLKSVNKTLYNDFWRKLDEILFGINRKFEIFNFFST